MGGGESKLPPITDHDLKILLSYGLREEHIVALYRKFLEVDTDCNGVWTVLEFYKLISEPRLSMRAPIVDAVFFMGDALGQGAINFQDFIVTLCSFCALSKEEMLQLLFIIIDKNRNGRVERQELLDFFSYVPAGCGANTEPIFPVNNKNALDKFRGGKWESLTFDGLAQLAERFPYIVYPAYHVQELYRAQLLGRAFWDKLDNERSRFYRLRREKFVQLPSSKQKVKVQMPGRCTMQELLEYSRRKTDVNNGKRVVRSGRPGESVSSLTKQRDDEIARCPLLCMIRNPHCMYYVPFHMSPELISKLNASHAEREEPELALEADPVGLKEGAQGVIHVVQRRGTSRTTVEEQNDLDQEESSSSGSYDSGDDSDLEEE